MSLKLCLLVASLSALFLGCAKNQSSNNKAASDPITQAKEYFEKSMSGMGKRTNTNNYRANQQRTPVWDSAKIAHLATGDAVIVPVAYQNKLLVSNKEAPGYAYQLNNLTSLVFTRDSNNLLLGTVITYIPDSSNTQQSPSGLYLVEDWQGNSMYRPAHFGSPATHSSKEADYVQSIQVCNEIDGYNYSEDDPGDGVTWSETSCTTYELPQGRVSGELPPFDLPSLPISRYFPPLEVIVAPPTAPISNIADYFKCFTNGTLPDHTYSVQVCVDQPDPGTRQPWSLTVGGPGGSTTAGNLVNVGHTFLVLTENDQGNIITRNVGFYPSSAIFPTGNLVSSQAVLNDDDSHPYNISLTINVNSNQFFGILNNVSLGNNPGYYYNLNSNNCTTFIINALSNNGIQLPITQGTWAGGSGDDPGDLGEDIRQMSLSSNMTRNTVSNPHPNVGTCN